MREFVEWIHQARPNIAPEHTVLIERLQAAVLLLATQTSSYTRALPMGRESVEGSARMLCSDAEGEGMLVHAAVSLDVPSEVVLCITLLDVRARDLPVEVRYDAVQDVWILEDYTFLVQADALLALEERGPAHEITPEQAVSTVTKWFAELCSRRYVDA